MATDYNTECGSLPLSFIQMLASCIFGYHDLAGLLHYRINGIAVTDDCAGLEDALFCNTSHVDPERQLVENTFALDDCGTNLGWKLFHNQDTHWTDYSECGEVPQTLIQLLARTIVDYSGTNRINAVIDADACTEVVALLSCITNQIESERLLVANVFAVDDCDRLLLKIFANSSTMTDYNTQCTESPLSFYQMLAQCIVSYNGHYYLNTASATGNCEDLHDFWTCAINHIDPERALVENVFATDACGNLALKLFDNQGEGR